MNLNTCVIGLGSNSHDRETQLDLAISNLLCNLQECKVSAIYETPDIRGKADNYLNAVVSGITEDDYDSINNLLKDWENICGRNKDDSAKGVVTIDLDLVVWNGEIVRPKDFEREYFSKGYNEIRHS